MSFFGFIKLLNYCFFYLAPVDDAYSSFMLVFIFLAPSLDLLSLILFFLPERNLLQKSNSITIFYLSILYRLAFFYFIPVIITGLFLFFVFFNLRKCYLCLFVVGLFCFVRYFIPHWKYHWYVYVFILIYGMNVL